MKLYLSSLKLGNNPERLVNLLSKNKKAAVILNAIDHTQSERRQEKVQSELTDLQSLGIQAEELDLRKYFGKNKELKEKLSEYGMVWVCGGNTFTLRRAYFYSGFDELVKEKVSDKEFVYAGYSAGICILAPSLKALAIVDNPNIIPDGYKPEVIWEGLGIIDYVIEPHYRSNHPESEMVEKEVQYCIDNKILFKALHDGEAIIEEI